MDRPGGERIKVRGDNYVADCRLPIAGWIKQVKCGMYLFDFQIA